MDAILEPLIASPDLPRHVETLGRLLADERADLGWVGSEKGLICLTRNDHEPDIIFYGPAKAALLQPDQMKLPAPDFIAEVLSPSTERADRGVKLADYAAHGVREYWIIDPEAETVERYVKTEPDRPDTPGAYQQSGAKTGDDEIVSAAVPGFQLSARARFDRQANLRALSALSALSA